MPRNRTVLVTGALGQLGKRLVALLLQRGHKVIASDLLSPATQAALTRLREENSGKGELVEGFVDLLDADGQKRLLADVQPDVVVHLAAIVSPPCYQNPAAARRVNVDGTRHLVEAAKLRKTRPFFILASSSAVHGSRNPHRHPERLTSDTPVRPIDCYGADKVAAEQIVASSGLPFVTMRLAGIISPDGLGKTDPSYMLLVRATPKDNRVHAVDVRDAALAFANAVDGGAELHGKTLLIGGNESYVKLQGELEDDVMEAIGLGRIGPSSGLLGDPNDDDGWGLTDWFDTTEAQRLLQFQNHQWKETLQCLADAQGEKLRAITLVAPVVRTLMRAYLRAQRRWERRGRYANPWALITKHYGPEILARSFRSVETASSTSEASS